jgi:hypothetical protein
MRTITANDNYFNIHPYHVVGRIIEPIDVIESWGLSYHLACTLKCISNFSCNDTPIIKMKEAIWYLDRFLYLFVEENEEERVVTPQTICVLEVALDWNLNCDLTMAITHLHDATQDRLIHHINAAKRYIENYIQHYNVQDKENINGKS